ncbi:YfiT family bacillithiol transferase [Chryseobacterium sp.]|uniref:YfiT family bacillithiol transferase n=1 Tax=Chryseobacterium sp. TaxID=1871047 RepID=UPI0011CB78E0|nr:putative metal-dependent hydrolase [Chryseobacterium sp.]TXF79399.1 putative metal-dependent hydrolase [Chryseobacterium sp.]
MKNIEHKKYPIGKFHYSDHVSDSEIDRCIGVIKNFPSKLKNLIENWTDEMLDTQYREKGWTVRQLINHLSDSHMQSFSRFKLALTEDNPTVKPYDEAKWAELQDSINIPVKPALYLLTGLHYRWFHLLKTLTNKEFERTFFHPEQNKTVILKEYLTFFAWHCDHHFAHIENLKKEKGWT